MNRPIIQSCFATAIAVLMACPKSQAATQVPSVEVVEVRGVVQYQKLGAAAWSNARRGLQLTPGDGLHTRQNGAAAIRQADKCIIRMPKNSFYRVTEPPEGKNIPGYEISLGSAYMNSRQGVGEVRFRTRLVSGAIRGTEAHIAVAADGTTEVTLIDGEVELTNPFGQLTLVSGEQGSVLPGQPPVKTAVLNLVNVIQWALYYPAVLDPNELGLTPAEAVALQESLTAYRAGALPVAARSYPINRVPQSPNEIIYRAALHLAMGEVPEAEVLLGQLPAQTANSAALRLIVATVKNDPAATELAAQSGFGDSASWQLARSYYLQSRLQLADALDSAKAATQSSAEFGYAWARVAELEFSFGRAMATELAIRNALSHSPSNAQAYAVLGFAQAARTGGSSLGTVGTSSAMDSFERAIELDPALANGWLGRGLMKIRAGEIESGREDLQVASAMEPNRALLRSYLGKAWHRQGESQLAHKEFNLGRKMDAADPTPWLYSALLNWQEGRINESIKELEESKKLNDNRALYRSRFLLDQDRAVRSANLANVFRDAGMEDVAAREAARAAQDDPANYSAHLFLADSFDPRSVNLRFETATVSEYLLANLLAPVGAGILSRTISQQEYSRFFERNRLGIISDTEYLSRGEWLQSGAVFGNTRRMSFSLDAAYRSDNGTRINNDLSLFQQSAQLKLQATPSDTIYLQSAWLDTQSGDRSQRYDPSGASATLRTAERQEPLLLAGLHHEWHPGSHTLLLAGRLIDTLHVTDSASPLLFVGRNGVGAIVSIATPALPVAPIDYGLEQEIYTVEAQQILQGESHSLTFGARYQTGGFDVSESSGVSSAVPLGTTTTTTLPFTLTTVATAQSIATDFERTSVYGYHNWRVVESLLLTAGLVYDHLDFPRNFRRTPVQPGQENRSQLSPKAGIIWTPLSNTAVRGSYTRSLGGASFEHSTRLEASQIAGFAQSFRSLIPESVVGPQIAPEFETWGLAWDQRLGSKTYVGIAGELLHSVVERDLGTFDQLTVLPFTGGTGITREVLGFQEKTLSASLHHLFGEHWVAGARYRMSVADLSDRLPEISTSVTPAADAQTSSTIQQLGFFAVFNHPSGWFARGEANWNDQSNRGFAPAQPGDSFWQMNLFGGYRFRNRRASLQVGLLNLTDRDYRLNPLNLHAELPRERTMAMRFRFSF